MAPSHPLLPVDRHRTRGGSAGWLATLMAGLAGLALSAQSLEVSTQALSQLIPWSTALAVAGILLLLGAWLWTRKMRALLYRRSMQLEEANRRLAHLLDASPVVLYSLHIEDDGEAALSWVSSNVERELGFTPRQVMAPGFWLSQVHPDDREKVRARLNDVLNRGKLELEYRFVDAYERVRWLHDSLRVDAEDGHPSRDAMGACRDITAQKLAELANEVRMDVLERLNRDMDLPLILEEIASRLEQLRPEMRVSILLRDPRQGHLVTVAAPSLPSHYNEAINRLRIDGGGEGRGACGNALASGKTVIVRDVLDHPFWEGGGELAERAGIRSCWSVPFCDERGQVAGTFAVYHTEPREPATADLRLIEEFARITALAVQRAEAMKLLHEAAAVLENTRDGVFVTDLEGTILSVNPAFTLITGYLPPEAIGQSTRLLSSGRHDETFYQKMWAALHDPGYWSGEIFNRRKDGEIIPLWMNISTIRDGQGRATHFVAVMSDLSDVRQSEERIEYLAHYDSLTGLPNRLLFQAQLKRALQQAIRHDTQVAVLLLDLDRFKQINESLGHEAGDTLLRSVADRLGRTVRVNDTVARVGSDEFAVLVEDIEDAARVVTLVEKLLQSFSQPFRVGEEELFITPSIGISLYPRDGHSCNDLIRNADTAMHVAKEQGANTFAFYSKGLTARAFERVMLENSLRKAIERDELRLLYQPQLDLTSGALVGVEALLRWQHPDLGLIGPGRFIELAEQTGLMIDIGEWVLRTACRQAHEWQEQGLDICVAVNVGHLQIRRGVIQEQVESALHSAHLPASHLKLEVLENFVMENAGASVVVLHTLRDRGVHLAIDDFGTGYSSLAYLHQLPMQQLKIDQSFVRDMPHDTGSQAIIRAIVALGDNLGLEVLAEGIETEEQRAFLVAEGCRLGQGYLLARPMPGSDISTWHGARATRMPDEV